MSERGTPPTMQRAVGSSLLFDDRRSLYKVSAHGWKGMSSGLRSFAMFPTYPGAGCQSPDISGLPSVILGAGAERLGFPSTVRGILGVGKLYHCALASESAAIRVHSACMEVPPR